LWEGLRPRAPNPELEPEEQSGIEAGVDLFVARTFTLQITRFDQIASGLIQRVALARDTGSTPVAAGERIAFQLQNVGEITNRGWEIQGALRRGGFSVASAFTQVDSRVRKIAHSYTGDLRPGDRMLEVPARTLSLTGAWSGSGWKASLTAYRAMDWINYDRVALAKAFATTDRPTRDFVGARLRTFWKEYPGVTHLGATLGVTLRRRFGLTLSGDNLLNRQTGEPDNITVLPGRTLSFGLRTEF
jgi:iron complex outermembrane receptor protein